MSKSFRAKMQVSEVLLTTCGERIKLNAVCKSGSYPADGSDEDNTYAKFSPSGSVELTIANPALFGAVKPGQKFYIDFSPVPEPTPAAQS